MRSQNKELILQVAKNLDDFEREIREDQHHKTKLACIVAVRESEHELDEDGRWKMIDKVAIMHIINSAEMGKELNMGQVSNAIKEQGMEISDQQIKEAFTGTQFGAIDGDVKAQRKFLAQGIMKRACDYSTGYTIKMILIRLELISEKTLEPSRASMQWMYDVYNH